MKEKVQLLGPITGNNNYKYDFDQTATVCVQMLNCTVFNPAHLDPDNELPDEEKLLICLDELRDKEAAVLVRRWETSNGVLDELAAVNAFNSYRAKRGEKAIRLYLPELIKIEPIEAIRMWIGNKNNPRNNPRNINQVNLVEGTNEP
ncbi:MAG: DUF4406 domain-containing protein [Victivallales bacterium]|nr:DUF4406 domain-containing protein [Victivallales bacterium]